MNRIALLLMALLLAGTAHATTFGPSEKTDPLMNEKVPARTIKSWGSYIYHWPSKYDLVFWPFTDENWICVNPKNGYAAFNNDFEKVSAEEKKTLTQWLAENYNPSQAPKSYEEKLAWLEKVYRQRKMGDDFWCRFYRLMAYVHREDQEKSLEYVKKALPLLEAQLKANPVGIDRIEALFLLGEYYRRTGEAEKAKEYFSQVITAKYKDENGKEQVGHPYFIGLVEDRGKPDAVRYLDQGDAQVGKGQLQAAISSFSKAIEIDPEYALAYVFRANAHADMGQHDLAVSDLDKAIKIVPTFARAYIVLGNAYMSSDQHDLAIFYFSKLIEFNPKIAEAYLARGSAYAEKRQFSPAFSDLHKAIDMSPKIADAFIRHGKFVTADHQYNLSDFYFGTQTEVLDKYIEANPQDALALIIRGKSYAEKHWYHMAISYLTKAIEIAPKLSEVYVLRGNIYAERSQQGPAISDFAKAMEINPELVNECYDRGKASAERYQRDLAIFFFTKFIEMNPRHAEAYIGRGNAYADKNQHDLALSDFAEAIKIDPQFADAYYKRGKGFSERDSSLAILYLTKALELNPKHAEAYIRRGKAHVEMGQYDMAISDYSKALEIDPTDAEAYYRRGELFAAKQQYDMAISDYSKSIGINPNHAWSYEGRGMAYRKRGEDNKAQDDFSEARRLDPSSSAPAIPTIKPAPGYIIDTGTPTKFGWWLVDPQWVASKFTVEPPGYSVTDIEAYFNPSGSAEVIMDITDCAGYTPGAFTYYSNRFFVDHEQKANWHGIHGITDLKLSPNDYWIIFRPAKQIDRIIEMPKDPPVPATNYAISVDLGRPTRRWQKSDVLNIGIRISGKPVS